MFEVLLNLEQAESALIQHALEQSGDNIAAAARMLGTSRSKTYRYLMKKGDKLKNAIGKPRIKLKFLQLLRWAAIE